MVRLPRFRLPVLFGLVVCIALAAALLRDDYLARNAYLLLPADLKRTIRNGKLRLDTDDPEKCVGKWCVLHDRSHVRLTKITLDTVQYCENLRDPSLDHTWDNEKGQTVPLHAVDLIANLDGGYHPRGILMWFPDLGEFGQYDGDHGVVIMFPDKTWKEIIEDPALFLNAQWYPETVDHYYLRPWVDERLRNPRFGAPCRLRGTLRPNEPGARNLSHELGPQIRTDRNSLRHLVDPGA